jgi:hypothetical protein
MQMHGTFAIGGTTPFVSTGSDSRGVLRRAVAAGPRRLPWLAAVLIMGALSAGLWLGIVRLVAALF